MSDEAEGRKPRGANIVQVGIFTLACLVIVSPAVIGYRVGLDERERRTACEKSGGVHVPGRFAEGGSICVSREVIISPAED